MDTSIEELEYHKHANLIGWHILPCWNTHSHWIEGVSECCITWLCVYDDDDDDFDMLGSDEDDGDDAEFEDIFFELSN